MTNYLLNASSLSQAYESLSSLSLYINDIGNIYILPEICIVGIVSNTLALLVLSRPAMRRSPLTRVFTLTTSADLCFTFISVFVAVIRCGNFCPYGYTKAAKIYEQWLQSLLLNCFCQFESPNRPAASNSFPCLGYHLWSFFDLLAF